MQQRRRRSLWSVYLSRGGNMTDLFMIEMVGLMIAVVTYMSLVVTHISVIFQVIRNGTLTCDPF